MRTRLCAPDRRRGQGMNNSQRTTCPRSSTRLKRAKTAAYEITMPTVAVQVAGTGLLPIGLVLFQCVALLLLVAWRHARRMGSPAPVCRRWSVQGRAGRAQPDDQRCNIESGAGPRVSLRY